MAKSLEERVLAFDKEMKKQDGYKVRYVEGATVIITNYMVTFLRGKTDNLINNHPCPRWTEPEQLISRRKAEDDEYLIALRNITQKKIKQASDARSDICCMGDLIPDNCTFNGFSSFDAAMRRSIAVTQNSFCQKIFLISVVRLFPDAYFTCKGLRELIYWADESTGSDGFICPYFIRKGGLA